MRTIAIVVRSKDRIGVISEIARVIAAMGLSIIESKARTYTNRKTSRPENEFRAILGCEDTAQEAELHSRLRRLRGCLAVSVVASGKAA